MREEEIVTGIVLYTTLLNEYDKRLVVLTKERGKITVFANGARRPNSQLRAASQSFVMGKFTVRPYRDSYNLLKVEVKDYFTEISMDIEKMCYASYFGEFMSYYTREGDSCVDNLNLFYVTLKALVEAKIPLELIRTVYELRLMDIEGQGIHAYACVKCGKKEELSYFSSAAGGFLCTECTGRLRDRMGIRRIEKGMAYTIQYILSAPINKLYTFTLSDELFKELIDISGEFVKKYIDKKFNSLEILETL